MSNDGERTEAIESNGIAAELTPENMAAAPRAAFVAGEELQKAISDGGVAHEDPTVLTEMEGSRESTHSSAARIRELERQNATLLARNKQLEFERVKLETDSQLPSFMWAMQRVFVVRRQGHSQRVG